MSEQQFKVLIIGLGYFSQFHIDAWSCNPNTKIAAVCDLDQHKAAAIGDNLGVEASDDINHLLEQFQFDIIDVIAPPIAHKEILTKIIGQAKIIICQKPFCISIAEAQEMIELADRHKCKIVIHENFRFQPWYREINDFLESGAMGQVYQARFDLRPGDGRGPNAYLERQPAFQKMERLLIHETGIHFVDLFQWLFGDAISVYADLEKLNPVIAGEDSGMFIMTHKNGAKSVFDGNRLMDNEAENPRLTMGDLQIEGEGGALKLTSDGRLSFRKFGEASWNLIPINYPVDPDSFGGGCVNALIRHVVDAMLNKGEFENLAEAYLKNMIVSEVIYLSDNQHKQIKITN